jgi:hypothetical protein
MPGRVKLSIAFCALLIGMALLLSGALLRAESAPEPTRTPLPSPDRTKAARPADPPGEFAPGNLALQHGQQRERLVYDIRVNGIPAGKAELEVRKVEPFGAENGPLVWVVDLDIRSNRAVSLFYDVRIRARSWIDMKAGFSRSYHITRREGDVKAEERITFKYDIGDMQAAYERPRADGQVRKYTLPLSGKTLDPLAALYYIRALDVDALVASGLPICADRRVWNTRFKLSSEGRSFEDIGKLKHRECIAIEPQLEFQGLFERKGQPTVWLDVKTMIPVKMKVEIPIGTAEVVLSEYENSPLDEAAAEEKADSSTVK